MSARQARKLPAGAPIAGASGAMGPAPSAAPKKRALEQLRLRLGNERKDTMTVAELRARQPERDIRADILTACLAYPKVAWMVRCEPYSGYVLPAARLKAFDAALHKRGSWTPAAVLALLRGFIAWREFTAPGMADIIGQLKPAQGETGAVVAIEVKKRGLKADAHQQAFLDLVTRNGGCAGVVSDASEAIGRIDAFSLDYLAGKVARMNYDPFKERLEK